MNNLLGLAQLMKFRDVKWELVPLPKFPIILMINIKIIIQKSCVTKNGSGHRTCIKCEAIDLDSVFVADKNWNTYF